MQNFLSNIKKIEEALSKIDRNFSQDFYMVCEESSEKLSLDFVTFKVH